MLTIIDRYISKMFLAYALAGLAVFVSIFLAADFMSTFVRYSPSTGVLGRYYIYYLPQMLYQMIPVACVAATVFTLSNLSRSNEIVALYSSGLSLARISAPILLPVALLSLLMYWLGDQVVPPFVKKKNYTYYTEIKKAPHLYSTVKTNRIWYRSNNVLFNIKTLNAEKNTAQGMTLYYFDGAWNLIQMIQAKEVELNEEQWLLKNGILTLFTPEDNSPMTKNFEQKSITIGEDSRDLQATSHTADVLSAREQKRFIEKNKAAGLDTRRYEVEYHGKFSFAMAAFVMSFLGIPFSVTRRRTGGSVFKNIGVVLALVFAYWIFYSSSMTIGTHGVVPPAIAAWTPNAVTSLLALVFLLRLRR